MMSTLMNSGFVISMGMFFTIIVVGLTKEFPHALSASLTGAGAASLIPSMSAIPPTGALFAAFLGYNPVQMILAGLPVAVTAGIGAATIATLTGATWFPTTLAGAFMPSLALTFYVGAALSVLSAVFCLMRGERYVHELHGTGAATIPAGTDPQEVSGKSER
jgi:hypothetical protein